MDDREKRQRENDEEWARKHCSFIFQKYIADKKADKIDMASELVNVFKDLSHLFDLEDYEDLLKETNQNLPTDLFVTKKEFEHYLVQWILEFKEEVSSSLITECLDVLEERYPANSKAIEEVLKNMSINTNNEIKLAQFPDFLATLTEVLEVRIVKLSVTKPKSDENVCDEKDEKSFFNDVAETAKNKGHMTLGKDKIEEILIEYFQGSECNYCFVSLPTIDEKQEIDPFRDLGESDPFGKNEVGPTQDDQELEMIETEMAQAQEEGDSKRFDLLKKIKQFHEIKQHANSDKERASCDLMISDVRKQMKSLHLQPTGVDDFNPMASGGHGDGFKHMAEKGYSPKRYQEFNQQEAYDNDEYRKPSKYSDSDHYYDDRNQNVRDSIDSRNRGHADPFNHDMDIYRNDHPRDNTRNDSRKDKQHNASMSPNTRHEIEKRLEEEPKETLPERREKGIKEIFDFYTRQHLMIGKKATFEQIQYEMSNLNMGEFMKFCKDFKIPVNKVKCAEIFKKTAKNSKEMFIEHFKESFPKLMAMKNKEEIESLEKRLKEVKKLMVQRKRKLEIDEPSPKANPLKKSVQFSKEDTDQNFDQEVDKIKDNVINQKASIGAKPFDVKKSLQKMPTKSVGGDPHGAVARMEEKQIEEMKKEQAEKAAKFEEEKSRNESQLSNRKSQNSQLSVHKSQTSLRGPADDSKENEEADMPVAPPEPKKVDEATLKKRMEEDKEINALQQEKQRILDKIEEVKRRPEDEKSLEEEALQFLQCDDPVKYRKKIKGFAAPFNMTEKDDRIKKEDKSLKYRYKNKEDKEIIKQKVKELKSKRASQKEAQEKEQQEQYQKHRKIMKNLHSKLKREKEGGVYESPVPGYQIHSSEQIYDISNSQPAVKLNSNQPNNSYGQSKNISHRLSPKAKKANKFTLETLGQLRYEDIAGGPDDGFNPADVLDEDDNDSEDEILKRYRGEEDARNALLVNQPGNAHNRNNQLKLHSMMPYDDPSMQNMKAKHHKKGVHNNSIMNGNDNLPTNSPSRKKLPTKSGRLSSKNLLVKSHEGGRSLGKRRNEPVTDDEKPYKNKLSHSKSRKADIPKGIAKSSRKLNDPYASDTGGKARNYPNSVSRSVKKQASKLAPDNMPKGKSTIIPPKQPNYSMHHGGKGNISMQMYERADKMEMKTKRNQNERLQNILKMHDNNMKKSIGVANKNRVL